MLDDINYRTYNDMTWIIYFHKRECYKCAVVSSIYQLFYEKYQHKDKLGIVQTNCDDIESRQLCETYTRKGLPQIIMLKGEKAHYFKYDVTVEYLWNFADIGHFEVDDKSHDIHF